MNTGIAFISNGMTVLDQEFSFTIRGYLHYKLFGMDLNLTTTHIAIILVMATLIVFALFANRAIKRADPEKAPGTFLNIIELMVESVDNLTHANMGERGQAFSNYIGTLFAFIDRKSVV